MHQDDGLLERQGMPDLHLTVGPVEYVCREKNDEGKVATGLLYIDTKAPDLYETLNAIDKPLNMLNEKELCPGSDKLKTINEGLN